MNPRFLAAVAALALALPVAAQAPFVPGVARPDPNAPYDSGARTNLPPDAVLAESGKAKVTRADYDLELTRLPADLRGGFATTEKRVVDLLTRMLVTKELAIEADENGVTREPYNAARLAYELERAKGQLRVAQIDKESGDLFERERAAYEKRGRELYKTQPQKYTLPESVSASHLLFVTSKRTPEQAMALARAARERIVAGAPFAVVASEVSEDPGSRAEGGRLPPFTRGQMDPAFEKAAFDLKQGVVSEPVVSQFGVHLILVASHQPGRLQSWDEVGPQIMAELRERFVAERREAVFAEMSEKARAGVNPEMVKRFIVERPSEQELYRIQRDATRNARESRQGKN